MAQPAHLVAATSDLGRNRALLAAARLRPFRQALLTMPRLRYFHQAEIFDIAQCATLVFVLKDRKTWLQFIYLL